MCSIKYLIFSLILFYCGYTQGFIESSWVMSNATTTCPDNLVLSNKILKIKNADNTTTGSKAYLNYFKDDGTEIGGYCDVSGSSSMNGYIKTTFSCNVQNSLFQTLESSVTAQWDLYDSLALVMNFTRKVQSGNETVTEVCSISGQNVSTYVEFDVWNITSCTCFPCCYNFGSDFSIARIPDILNYISINMTGSISGPYCNNTLALVDNCRLLSTELNTDVEPDMNTTYINCDYLGNRQTTYFTFQNKSLTLNWGECAMTAEPKILAQYGSYLKPIIMLLVLIFLLI